LEKNNRFLDALLDSIPIPVYHKDRKGVYLGVTEAFCKAVGRERETIKDRTVADIWHDSTVIWSEKTDQLVYETGRLQKHEGRVLYCDGLHHEVLESKNPLIDTEGRIIGIVGSITDITERKIHESKIRYLAHYDNLTGLHNRHYFYDQLNKAISKGKRSGSKVFLMFIDLDGFKEINDTYGHIAGDATLKSIGSRLQAITRDYDTVCRVGGDEFAFLLEEFVDREAAVSVAGKILKELSKPIPFKDYECSVSGSIGIAIFPQNTVSAEQLVTLADQAMYKAKSLGKDQYYFSEASPVEMSDGNKR